MVQTYHPPLMEVAHDTLPELQPIFTFLNSHSNKLYQEGYFLKLNDQDTRKPPVAMPQLVLAWRPLLTRPSRGQVEPRSNLDRMLRPACRYGAVALGRGRARRRRRGGRDRPELRQSHRRLHQDGRSPPSPQRRPRRTSSRATGLTPDVDRNPTHQEPGRPALAQRAERVDGGQ